MAIMTTLVSGTFVLPSPSQHMVRPPQSMFRGVQNIIVCNVISLSPLLQPWLRLMPG